MITDKQAFNFIEAMKVAIASPSKPEDEIVDIVKEMFNEAVTGSSNNVISLSGEIRNIVSLTQTEYDTLGEDVESTTLYLIVEESA